MEFTPSDLVTIFSLLLVAMAAAEWRGGGGGGGMRLQTTAR